VGETAAIGTDDFDFDEEVLLRGADFFELLAERFA
jgi:hypothetical protein